MRPAKGSASVLYTKMETGSVSLIFRCISFPFAGGFAVADGHAALRRVGKHIRQQIEQRGAADIVQRARSAPRDKCAWPERRRAGPSVRSSIGSVPFSKNSSISASSPSATISTSVSWRLLAASARSSGISSIFGLAVAVRSVDVRLHRDQIDHAAKSVLRADRQLQRHDVAAEHARERFHGAVVARQLAVHPVDGERARQVILDRVVPHFFGHHLHAGHARPPRSAPRRPPPATRACRSETCCSPAYPEN